MDGLRTISGPMRIFTRYVTLELIKVFVVSLTGLTVLMLVVGVFREASSQNLPLRQVLQLMPYVLPDALRVAIPVTLLLAVTSVYGRMSGSNEVVATKALGISPMTLLWPTLVLSFLASMLTVWLNDVAVSWGRNGARRVVIEAVEEIAYSMLKAQKSYASQNFSIIVRDVQGRKLLRPIVSLQATPDHPGVTVTAEEAELSSDPGKGVLTVVLRNGKFDMDGRVTYQFPDVYTQDVPLRDASRAQDMSASASWMPLRVIPEKQAEQERFLQRYRTEMAARAGFQMLSGDFSSLVHDQWDYRAHGLEQNEGQLHRLLTEPHRRWSTGFSCLCFALVGAPMAIRLRNRDFLTSFFLCFLPILIVYYPMLAGAVDGAKSGMLPPWSVWAGNLLLLLWGWLLLKKVLRY